MPHSARRTLIFRIPNLAIGVLAEGLGTGVMVPPGAIGGLVASFGRALTGGGEKLGISSKSFIDSRESANVFCVAYF
jgi:hypothetical protein